MMSNALLGRKNYSYPPLKNFSGECNRLCRPQCSFTTYEIQKKLAKFSSLSSFKTMRTLFRRNNPTLMPAVNVTFELWKQRVFDVSIHFRSLRSKNISVRLKYSFLDVLSSFGGLGGLFIGASLVTLVEIGFLLADFIGFLTKAIAIRSVNVRGINPLTSLPSIQAENLKSTSSP